MRSNPVAGVLENLVAARRDEELSAAARAWLSPVLARWVGVLPRLRGHRGFNGDGRPVLVNLAVPDAPVSRCLLQDRHLLLRVPSTLVDTVPAVLTTCPLPRDEVAYFVLACRPKGVDLVKRLDGLGTGARRVSVRS